jgi:protein gp37
MGASSKIEWTDHTFNPWQGCQHVSPGCDHCYAEAMLDTWLHKVAWGPHGKRVRTSEQTWREPLRWERQALAANRRHRVFCASLADWLDNKVPQQWRHDLAELIAATPHLDWLLLTKRIENYRRLAPWRVCPANVWLGFTGEDQCRYDPRWERLRQIEASVRFVSYEPAIGPLTLRGGIGRPDWVICGGETGRHPRYMPHAWARELRDECAAAGVAFFLKQMTSKAAIPPDLLVREFPLPRRWEAAA